MPRVTHVKKARKDHKAAGIKKGESYYWWKFMSGGRGGSKRYSKTPPKPSQLTQSEFWSAIYSLQERDAPPYAADLESEIEDIRSEVENIRDECQVKYDNLPDSLQNGASGELQQGRVDACDEAIGMLESIDHTFDPGDAEEGSDEYEEKEQERISEVWDEVQEALSGISCE